MWDIYFQPPGTNELVDSMMTPPQLTWSRLTSRKSFSVAAMAPERVLMRKEGHDDAFMRNPESHQHSHINQSFKSRVGPTRAQHIPLPKALQWHHNEYDGISNP